MDESNFLEVASDVEVRSVIRFLRFKKNSPIEIHRELKAVYGDKVMSVQHVRKWCRLFDEGRNQVADHARSGRPSVVNDDLVRRVEEKIREDSRITFDDLEFHFQQISRGTLHSIVHDRLGFRKVCDRWVTKFED